jgi:hypothetical protein
MPILNMICHELKDRARTAPEFDFYPLRFTKRARLSSHAPAGNLAGKNLLCFAKSLTLLEKFKAFEFSWAPY